MSFLKLIFPKKHEKIFEQIYSNKKERGSNNNYNYILDNFIH